jgi:predicted metal-dependent peptidase
MEGVMKKKKKYDDYNVLLQDATIRLQGALYRIKNKDVFFGGALSITDINFSNRVPTAGVMINDKTSSYEMAINPAYFMWIPKEESEDVIGHEMDHIIRGDLAKVPFLKVIGEKATKKWNIATDGAINQYRPLLLKNGVNIVEMEDKNGNMFEPHLPAEIYYDGLGDDAEEQFKKSKGGQEKQENKESCPVCDGDGFDENGKPCPNGCQPDFGGGSVKIQGSGAQPGDHSNWSDIGGKITEEEAIKITEQLIERTLQKEGLQHSQLPGHVKSFMKYAEKRKKQLNYKALLNKAIKRSASGMGRKGTWKRPNRKYGEEAKGRKPGMAPMVHLFVDTSGSISADEINDFIAVVKGLMRVTQNECNVTFFHTDVYGTRKLKKASKMARTDLQSGGTELTPVMKMIAKKKPELSLILTDGGYSDVPFEKFVRRGEKFPTTCWIISKGGNEKHPMERLGTTIKIPE